MPPVTLLVNPSAGDGRVLERWPQLPRLLAPLGRVEVVAPSTPSALAEHARAAAACGHVLVVAGGDGTVNRVLNALSGGRPRLGVLPVGSGNDFARAIGLPLDPIAAARRIAAGSPVALDVIQANGCRFATVGGVGLVADASALVARVGRHGAAWRPLVRALGPHTYLVAATAQILLKRRTTARVAVAGHGRAGPWRWDGACHAVLVANHSLLGAGLQLPVPSSSRDGECEICIVPRDTRIGLARNLACLRGRRALPDGALLVFRAHRAEIACEDEVGFAADGEVLEHARRFSVAVQPGAIDVIC